MFSVFIRNGENHLINKEPRAETDKHTHIYTLILKPDNTYVVKIDNEEVQNGSLFDDWDIAAPKMIKDSTVRKPEDWDDRRMMLVLDPIPNLNVTYFTKWSR